MKRNLLLIPLFVVFLLGCKKERTKLSDQEIAQAKLDEIITNTPTSINVDYRDSTAVYIYPSGKVETKKIIDNNVKKSSIESTDVTNSTTSESGRRSTVSVGISGNPVTVSCSASYRVAVINQGDLPPYYYISAVDEMSMALNNASVTQVSGSTKTTYYTVMSGQRTNHSQIGGKNITFYFGADLISRTTIQYGTSAPISQGSNQTFNATSYGTAP